MDDPKVGYFPPVSGTEAGTGHSEYLAERMGSPHEKLGHIQIRDFWLRAYCPDLGGALVYEVVCQNRNFLTSEEGIVVSGPMRDAIQGWWQHRRNLGVAQDLAEYYTALTEVANPVP